MPKAFSFAHLLGFGAAKAAEDDEKDKKRDDETEEEYQDRMAESEDDDKKAEDEKDKSDASDDDEKDDKKSEKDDDEDDKKSKKAVKAAVLGERARCAAIFSSPSAAARPDLAAHLAFNTDMTTSAAIDLLKVSAVNPAGKPSLAGRMSTVIVPNPGTGPEQGANAGSPATTAAAIIAAGKKARGEA